VAGERATLADPGNSGQDRKIKNLNSNVLEWVNDSLSLNILTSIWGPKSAHACWPITNIVQYSDEFMHYIVLHSIVLLCSLLYCIVSIVNVLLGGYNTIQCHA